MGARISVDDCKLILRGWCESKRRLRVVFTHPVASFAVFGTVWATNDVGFSISIDELNMVSVSLLECECGFMDLPEGEKVLGQGIESGLVVVRKDFNLVIMLLL
jgi:hypothetical protein